MHKADLTPQDMGKMKALLSQDNAVEFMSSEESEGEGMETGPAQRHIKPLRWERSKLRNLKAALDATYQAQMNRRQKRTAEKDGSKGCQISRAKSVRQANPKELSFLGRTGTRKLRYMYLELIIIWLSQTRTRKYQIREFDLFKSI